MRKLKFFPYNTSHEVQIARICSEDDLPAFWYFIVNKKEYYGTCTTHAQAHLAAEKELECIYEIMTGGEPRVGITPLNYANLAGYDTVKDWTAVYKKDRKSWISKIKVQVGWTLKG